MQDHLDEVAKDNLGFLAIELPPGVKAGLKFVVKWTGIALAISLIMLGAVGLVVGGAHGLGFF